jgi:hypothetical protein
MFRMWLFTVSSVSDSSEAIILFGLPLQYQPQYINFSCCQWVVRGVLGDFDCDLRGEAFLPGINRANCLQ